MQLSIALTALLVTSAHAWRPKDRHCGGMGLCLTSFIWCDIVPSVDCYYPENVYPQDPSQRNPRQTEGMTPTLIWDKTYRLEWRTNRTDLPVTVQWTMRDSYEMGSAREGIAQTMRWEVNVTDENFFDFSPNSDMFPNPLSPNVTFAQARGYASGQNFLSVSQYTNQTLENGTTVADDEGRNEFSHAFVVSSQDVQEFIKYAKSERPHEVEDRWRRKMSLGLGLGIGLGIVVTHLVTWAAAQWWARRQVRLYGEAKGLGGKRWWSGI